jgi:hypothetical protein
MSLAATALTAIAAIAYNVTGTVTDTFGEPLIDATVRILSAKDSTYVKGAIADKKGSFSFTGVNNGSYIAEANYIGYTKTYKPFTVKGSSVKLDTIHVAESSIMLKEATVTGVKTPIKVMQDTIEFNADSYKTQPNAVVEDLLKRLPGVEVDSSGKITANGKEISKILVDGKEFFADDPKVASKNLPVNMVEKLQVIDRKSDLARLTGVDDGEDETVINLSVKPGMKNGWFGTVEAGYGTDDRYQATFNVNRFWNGNQLTFIGSANNTNDLGFTDGNGNRFRRFGGDQGINNSQTFGVNFNVGKDEKLRFGGDVMYSHTNRNTIKRQSQQYLFPDSTSFENSRSDAVDRGHNIRADFRIEWKPDSFNTFDFRPTFSYNQNNSNSLATDTLLAGSAGYPWVNRTFNQSSSDGKSYEASGRLIYNHSFASHRGRSFSIMANYSFSDVREDDNALAFNRFNPEFLKSWNNTDSIDAYDQYTDSHSWNNNVSARVSWTEPIGDSTKGRFITFSYRFQYRWNNSDKIIYRRYPDAINNFDDPYNLTYGDYQQIDSLSSSFRNNYMTQDIRAGFKLVKKKYTMDVGMSVIPSMSESKDLINSRRDIAERWVWNYAPYLRYRYRFDKQSSLNLDYNGRSSQPSMSQLQPVADYTNSLNVVQGNPNLKPTFTHNFQLRMQRFYTESQRSIMMMLDGSMTQNSIVSRTTYDSNSGGRLTTYENVNGVWSARLMNMFSQPFGSSKQWAFNNHIFVNYNQQIGFNNGLRNRSGALTVSESPSLAFRPENLELELRPNYRVQKTFNSLANVNTSTIHSYGGSFNATYYTPINLVLASDVNYSATKGYSEGYNTNQWMWNASISYQFMHGKAATVMLKVYDLLQQKSNIQRSITANYISDTEYNSLTRYFMLTFTYRFNTFGKGKEPSSFGDGGPDGPGGGPGGRRGGPGGPGGGGPGGGGPGGR